MNSHRALTALLAAALTLGPAAASADDWPHDRSGFTAGIRLGVGATTTDTHGADPQDGSIAGGVGALHVGYAVSPGFVLSLEGIAWGNESFGVAQSLSVGGLGLTWFPQEGGFYLRGVVGGGDALYRTRIAGAPVEIDQSGGGFSLGTGYEWRVSRRLALGPSLDLIGVDFDRGKAHSTTFTFGLQLYL